jgi:hypothetical protein
VDHDVEIERADVRVARRIVYRRLMVASPLGTATMTS